MSTEIERQKVIEKCARFNAWCKEVGIICPKLDYPAFFEGGLVGAKFNSEVKHREAFLFVPFTAIISIDKCRKDPKLCDFYNENP